MGRAFSPSLTQRQAFPVQQSRILCATDLTPRSERAVQAAALIANRLNAQLTLMHVLDAGASAEHNESMHANLTEQLARTALRTGAVPALAVRRDKQPHVAIAQVAAEGGANLIVLGSQKRRMFAPLMGTTAERVSALTARPVLIVNSDTPLRYDGVVIAADLTDGFSDLLELAGPLGFLAAGSVTVAHGFESPYRGVRHAEGLDVQAARREIARWRRRAQEHFRSQLDEAGVDSSRSRIVVREMKPWGVVRRTLKSFSRPLLILGTSLHTPLSRAVRGSLANDALLSLNCDVLVAAPAGGMARRPLQGTRQRKVEQKATASAAPMNTAMTSRSVVERPSR